MYFDLSLTYLPLIPRTCFSLVFDQCQFFWVGFGPLARPLIQNTSIGSLQGKPSETPARPRRALENPEALRDPAEGFKNPSEKQPYWESDGDPVHA